MNYSRLIDEFCAIHKMSRKQLLKWSRPSKRILKLIVEDLLSYCELSMEQVFEVLCVDSEQDKKKLTKLLTEDDYYTSMYSNGKDTRVWALQRKKVWVSMRLEWVELQIKEVSSPRWIEIVKEYHLLKGKQRTIDLKLENLRTGHPVNGYPDYWVNPCKIINGIGSDGGFYLRN